MSPKVLLKDSPRGRFSYYVFQGVLRSKCVRLPVGVSDAEFAEEWSEHERIEYGNNEGKTAYT